MDFMITPGVKIAGTHWTIVQVDDDGRRTLVQCICGNSKLVFTAALRDGTVAPSCGCRPLAREQLTAQRQEQEQLEQHRELRKWRP
jgi:hypothetical protein